MIQFLNFAPNTLSYNRELELLGVLHVYLTLRYKYVFMKGICNPNEKIG